VELSNSTGGLGQSDFVPLSVRGFGDGWNAYIHGMNWFEGALYCGTFRANLCQKRRQKEGGPQYGIWPIACPDIGDEFNKIDCRAQLWRFDPVTQQWTMVQQAPMVMGRNGQMVQRECAYRGIFVFQGKSDPKPVLYVTPFANTVSPGPQILRSEDGIHFEPCTKPGLGLDGVSSFRAFVAFKGKAYTSPVGATGNVVNFSKYPIVFETDDPMGDNWRQVSEPGFGDPNNSVVFNLAVMGDYLYAGTFNHVTGMEIWKTDAEGEPPYRWTKVIEHGAYRGNLNEGALAMCAFNGALYVGTCIQDGGFDRVNGIGPAGAELLRIFPDDSWELLVGGARLTERGLLVPRSGLAAGFNDMFNGYFWRMAVHDGRLYVGTVNWSTFIRYLNVERWPEAMRDMVSSWGLDETIARFAGFDLWCTADGEHFEPVTTSGFGNSFNIGARTLVSTPIGLCLGTVNPFGPTVAVRDGDNWRYAPNPRGGGEVWLGATSIPDAIRNMTPQGAPQGARADDYRLPPVAAAQPRAGRRVDPGVRDFDEFELWERSRHIALEAEAGRVLAETREQFSVRIEGAEHIPADGPVLVLGNNPAVPLLVRGVAVAAHTLLVLDELTRKREQPAWHLARPPQFESVWSERALSTLDRLGMIPLTRVNARLLLDMGQAVFINLEEKSSAPPYQLRPFDPRIMDFVADIGVPVLLAVSVGMHESHLLIEHDDHQVILNPGKPLDAQYVIRFVPPVTGLDAEAIREVMQANIDILVEQRPRTKLVRYLDRRYGRSADAIAG
jgi:hypothetical protein